jgi:hypothetical protein
MSVEAALTLAVVFDIIMLAWLFALTANVRALESDLLAMYRETRERTK